MDKTNTQASFFIPAKTVSTEIEVKRSRFIAYLSHTHGSAQAKAFIADLKEKYPDARHHCYGFVAGSPNDSNQYGFSDDGEPSGTAGMPIFNHLKHKDIGEVCIVVVRYFGGTKLGTGGLARAYGDAAKAVLEIAELKSYIAMEAITLELDFSQEQLVRKIISEADGEITGVEYGSNIVLTAKVPLNAELNLPYSVVRASESTM